MKSHAVYATILHLECSGIGQATTLAHVLFCVPAWALCIAIIEYVGARCTYYKTHLSQGVGVYLLVENTPKRACPPHARAASHQRSMPARSNTASLHTATPRSRTPQASNTATSHRTDGILQACSPYSLYKLCWHLRNRGGIRTVPRSAPSSLPVSLPPSLFLMQA